MAELQNLLHQDSASRPSDRDLEYACKIANKIQELLHYVSYVHCPSAHSRRVKWAPTTWPKINDKPRIVQIVLWYLNSSYSKHMTRRLDQLINFVSKFMRTVRFGNDHFVDIMGYGDLQIGNVYISRVYYVKGLGHNLLSVGQFFDTDLEVAFCKNTCLVLTCSSCMFMHFDTNTCCSLLIISRSKSMLRVSERVAAERVEGTRSL
ncbi:hypothetical protein Tco_0051303 [Tanacetum coccineum]